MNRLDELQLEARRLDLDLELAREALAARAESLVERTSPRARLGLFLIHAGLRLNPRAAESASRQPESAPTR